MDKLFITIACATFIGTPLASAQDVSDPPSAHSADLLYQSNPLETQWAWATEPHPLRRADAPDPAGLTRDIQGTQIPPFDLSPSTRTRTDDYLFGSRREALPAFPTQGQIATLGEVFEDAPAALSSRSGTPPAGPRAISPLKGTTGRFATCTEQVWPDPEGHRAQGPQRDTWGAPRHCTPRYLSFLY